MALVACVMNVRPLKLVFCRNQGRAPQWSRWKLMEGGRVSTNICGTSVSSCCRQSCDHSEAVNSLADEQQVDLSWVDQVNVGQSVHPLQTRMDPTVQLTHTKRHRRLHTLRLHVHSWKVHIHYLTMIFLPLNSRMMQDRPTS